MAVNSIRVRVGERWYTVEVEDLSASPVRVTVEGETFEVEVEGLPAARPSPRRGTQPRPPRAGPPPPARTGAARGAGSEKVITSPMPGRVVAVNVRPGDTVSSGQEVCVVEAMKMEQSILASADGIIKAVHIRPFQQVGADEPLIELE